MGQSATVLNVAVIVLTLTIALTTGCWDANERYPYAGPLDSLIAGSETITIVPPSGKAIDTGLSPRAGADGRILVRMIPQYQLGVFGRGGHLIRMIGNQGYGPGEIRMIQSWEEGEHGRISILDRMTDDVIIFDSLGHFILTFRPEIPRPMVFLSVEGRYVFFYGADATRTDFSHIVSFEVSDSGHIVRSADYLKSSEESIRTRGIESRALDKNAEGAIVLAFLGARSFYHITKGGQVTEVDLDTKSYEVTSTMDLARAFEEGFIGGLVSTLFTRSRVLHVGFVDEDVVGVSFATGRFERTRFFFQLYSVTGRSALTRAYETPFETRAMGRGLFGRLYQSQTASGAEGDTVQLTIMRLQAPGEWQGPGNSDS